MRKMRTTMRRRTKRIPMMTVVARRSADPALAGNGT
jgi:hypothetical protein